MLTAILSGSALAVAGLQMQTIFRNPLAGPYVLGISSGASLGVAVFILGFSSSLGAGLSYNLGSWLMIIAGWLGAGMVLLLIFAVSIRVSDVMTILILGVLFGSAISAVISILQFVGNATELKTFVMWTLGSVSGTTKEQLYVLAPVVLTGIIISFISVKQLDVLLLGEEYAKTSGLNVLRTRLMIFTSTSLLAGSITAFCGPIGFIGIVVPHIARSVFKTAMHKVLIPASAIFGAIILLISDIISGLPLYTGTLPINSITALIGIPFVFLIIIKSKI